MISCDDIVDVVVETLKESPTLKITPEPGGKKPLPAKRIFLSEYELIKLLGQSKKLNLPRNAILSPFAQDWITLKGITIEFIEE